MNIAPTSRVNRVEIDEPKHFTLISLDDVGGEREWGAGSTDRNTENGPKSQPISPTITIKLSCESATGQNKGGRRG